MKMLHCAIRDNTRGDLQIAWHRWRIDLWYGLPSYRQAKVPS